jgi:hypothetical protein
MAPVSCQNFIREQESLKEVDVQNLLGCCANTFWAVGSIGGQCGPKVLFTRVNSTAGTVASPLWPPGVAPPIYIDPSFIFGLEFVLQVSFSYN